MNYLCISLFMVSRDVNEPYNIYIYIYIYLFFKRPFRYTGARFPVQETLQWPMFTKCSHVYF